MDASAAAAPLAASAPNRAATNGGNSARPAVSTTPTSSAPKNAPRIEPDASDDDDHERQNQDVLAHAHLHRQQRAQHARLPARTGQRPGKHPREQTPHGTPMASAMSRLDAPARTCMPKRVRVTSRYKQQRHQQAHSDDEEPIGGIVKVRQKLHRPGQRVRRVQLRGWLPQIMRTASLAMSSMANVPSTCDRWSRR
jgi:hypothetical protein